MTWLVSMYRNGERVVAAYCGDPELVARMKLLAGEMRLRVEVGEVPQILRPFVSGSQPEEGKRE